MYAAPRSPPGLLPSLQPLRWLQATRLHCSYTAREAP